MINLLIVGLKEFDKEKLTSLNSELNISFANTFSELKSHNRNQIVDIILAECDLPDKDCKYITDNIKEINSDAEVILVNSTDDAKLIRKAFKNGVFDFQTYPLNYSEINETILEAYQKQLRDISISESEEKFWKIAETAQDGIIIIDNYGKAKFWNKAAERIFGFSQNEILEQDIHKILAPQKYHERFQIAFKQFIKDGSGAAIGKTVELDAIHKDGSIFPIELSLSSLRIRNKWFGVSIIRDITWTRMAESIMTQNENRLLSFINGLPVGAIYFGSDKLIANKIVEKITGYSDTEYYSKESWIELICTDNYSSIIKKCDSLKTSGFKESLKIKCKHKSGVPKWIEISGTYTENNEVWILSDITEKLVAEQRIKVLTQAIEQSSACIVITDIKGNVEYVNPYFSKLTGYSFEEVMGASTSVLKSGVHNDEFYKIMWQTILEGKVWQGEFCNKDKEGKLFWESANIAPVKNKKGEIINFVAVKEDITEKKKIQEELVESEKKLRVALDTKDRFFSIIAHDLRNPFQSLIGLSEVLLEDFDQLNQEEISEMVQVISNSSKNAYNLVQDLLEWARSQTGRIEFNPKKIELKNIVEEEIRNIEVQAQTKNISVLSAVIKPTHVFADPAMIKTVIRNLLSNAVKFSYHSGKVVIKTYDLDEYIRINISDNGVGINTSIGKDLFKLDKKITSSGTSNEKGTGLGLILCKEFVERNNGIIGFENNTGPGTSFYFTLPKK